MRFRSSFWIAAFALASCGPGAWQRPILDKSEATYDFSRASYAATLGHLRGPLEGEWVSCEGPCATKTVTVKPPAGLKDLRSTYGDKGDADVGAIVWRGTIPAGVSSIALPMVAGPETSWTRVIAKCGAITRTLAPVDAWTYRRLTFKRPGGSCELEIRATDSGASWEQWVAIGTPEIVD